MKGFIGGIIGFCVGAGAGYFFAKWQYKKKLKSQIESIEETQKELYSKKSKDAENAIEDVDGHVDVYALSEEEIRNGEASLDDNDGDNVDRDAGEDVNDEDDGKVPWIDYDTKARLEFEQKFAGYVGTSIPYPITQEQYEDEHENSKIELVFYPEEDKAYTQRGNEEYETFHTDIGDEEYDTLNPDNCFDFPGCYYIRNDAEGIDFYVEISNRILEDMPTSMI